LKSRLQWLKTARAKQIVPDGVEWDVWLLLAGRGFGKTRTITQEGAHRALWYPGTRWAVVAPTLGDLRRISFEGKSGLLNVIPEALMRGGSKKTAYNKSLFELHLANGSVFFGYSAEEPDRLRGPEHHGALCEEMASWPYEDAWDQLQFGLRLSIAGDDTFRPQVLIATTPRPTAMIKMLVEKQKEMRVVITRGSTFENSANLAASALRKLKARYEGTRLGRQELHAELLGDTPGALWTLSIIDAARIMLRPDGSASRPLPDFERTVVAIDPMVGAPDEELRPGKGSETGIVVVARGVDGHAYVLADGSKAGTPAEWAKAALRLYEVFQADAIVAEVNQGGLMVENTIRTSPGGEDVSYRAVHASKGKVTRAEPISSLYERGKVHHVGTFGHMEDQMTTYVPGNTSPDRMDALVWALTELMIDQIAVPTDLHSYEEASAWNFD